MFTGIIEEIGIVSNVKFMVDSCQIHINARKILDDCKEGDSIAINGACLTVIKVLSNGFIADIMPETVRRTNLKDLRVGDKVNLERALRPTDRMGGHIVAGHVDGIGKIIAFKTEGIATLMDVDVPSELTKYIAIKGSISVDGVSLTITKVSNSGFQVSLIPFTKQNTILGLKQPGDSVNIEVDMFARYIERLIIRQKEEQNSIIDEDFLKLHGFL